MGGTLKRKLLAAAEISAEVFALSGSVALEIVVLDSTSPLSLWIFGFVFIERSLRASAPEECAAGGEVC